MSKTWLGVVQSTEGGRGHISLGRKQMQSAWVSELLLVRQERGLSDPG